MNNINEHEQNRTKYDGLQLEMIENIISVEFCFFFSIVQYFIAFWDS